MLPNFESFLNATPEKGVIMVEYYWQPPVTKNSKLGTKTSMVFFKHLRASDKCWCGSKKSFARCHRRAEDWSYVTLDPGQRASSPVVLLTQSFGIVDYARVSARLETATELLPIEKIMHLTTWGVPITPPLVNEIGTLIVGTITASPNEIYLEANSEPRLAFLAERVRDLCGDALGRGQTRGAAPQKVFPKPKRAHKE